MRKNLNLMRIILFMLSAEAHCQGYDAVYTWAPHAYVNPTIALPKVDIGPADLSTGHTRANEIRSLLGGYLLDKISTIEQVQDDAETLKPSNRYAHYLNIKPMITHYCTSEENQVFDTTDLSDEGADKLNRCAERAIRFEAPLLRKIKTAIYRSDQEQAFLKCTVYDLQGVCLRQPLQEINFSFLEQKPMYQLPYLPTFSDLQDYARNKINEGKMPPFTEGEYKTWIHNNFIASDEENWYKHNITLEPLREDFIRTITVDKDPLQPQLGKTHIFELLPNGAPNIDEKAYRRAHKQWVLDKDFLKEILMHGNQNAWAIQKDFVKSEDKTYTQAQNYANSRGPLVDETNKLLTGDDPSLRKIQKAPKPNEPPPSYTGREKVITPILLPTTNTTESVTYNPEIFTIDSLIKNDSN